MGGRGWAPRGGGVGGRRGAPLTAGLVHIETSGHTAAAAGGETTATSLHGFIQNSDTRARMRSMCGSVDSV